MDTNENNVVMENNHQVQTMDIPEVQDVKNEPDVITQYVEVPTTNKVACAACAVGGVATGVVATLGVIKLIKLIFKKEDPKPEVPEETEE